MLFLSSKNKPAEPAVPESERIRIGLMGVGHLGQHHARLLASIPHARLVGITDLDFDRAKKFADQYHTTAFKSADEFPSDIQALAIVTPTPTHYQIARAGLQKGLHCFVEKPLTIKVTEAEELISLAQQKNLVLQVGHVERFNPGVVEMAKHVQDPVFIETNRLGPYDPRVSHVGVVLDLMIHDIDIVLSLVKDKVVRVEALGAKLLSDHEDIAKVTLHFSRGCRADLVASRASIKRYRKIRVFQPNAYLSLDYSEKSLKIFKKKKPRVESMLDVSISRPRVAKHEPLDAELRHFIQCVREGKTPLVSGEHGRDALEIVLEIQKQIHVHSL
ncbi:MAG TPA: Gfo/Idh/MocA family oxidoreductase [Elusimicrobiota bacterium]|nr:Gfo/Idh/MocA family oxidoreductase [Elusimicrobiota bacterium]